MKTRYILILIVLTGFIGSVDALEVTAKKSILDGATATDSSVELGEEYVIGLAIPNTADVAMDFLEIEVRGVDEDWVTFIPEIENVDLGDLATGQIKIEFLEKGDYTIEVVMTGEYTVEINEGETSYEAFTQIAEVDATWNDVYNSYWINSIDGISGEWTDETKTGWSYYKNGGYSLCGVGATSTGCPPSGDTLEEGDEIFERFDNLEDWTSPELVPMQTFSVTVTEPEGEEEIVESSSSRRRRSRGGSSSSSSSDNSVPFEPQVIVPPIVQDLPQQEESNTLELSSHQSQPPAQIIASKTPEKNSGTNTLLISTVILTIGIGVLSIFIIKRW